VEKTKYYSGIKSYIALRIRNPADAEDLTQCVFFEFYRSNYQESELQNVKAYLFGIARKLISNYYRQKDKELRFLQTIPNITDKASCDNYSRDTQELIEKIDNIISGLPPKAREAVELRLIDDLGPKEAARKARCSVDRFYDRFYEGLKIIREKVRR
jgi:RNA polymerase sigma-70 factor (ECF subfamily)